MGLLEKLWDDTVAGPRPESGLGKLRKFDFQSNSGKDHLDVGTGSRSYEAAGTGDEAVRVTRKIMIVKPPGYQSPPVSPAGSTPPVSPLSGSRDAFRFRRSASNAYEKASQTTPSAGARSAPSP